MTTGEMKLTISMTKVGNQVSVLVNDVPAGCIELDDCQHYPWESFYYLNSSGCEIKECMKCGKVINFSEDE